MSSPSKIPLPKSRLAAASSAAASAEDLSAAAASPVHVSRIPKAVSPERQIQPRQAQPSPFLYCQLLPDNMEDNNVVFDLSVSCK